ncbi:MAG: 1,4-dihydroxy-6-naphthoate synthase [Desulfarculaceae bacterium]|jgi:1,4-dihydroxy-6-naphthoate synthase
MTPDLTFGFSPCPNDTFSFHALIKGLVPCPGFRVRAHLADVEELNQRALQKEFELTKLSFHALGRVLDHYALLKAGSALGRGCGPLLVTRPGDMPQDLTQALVAVPGRLTTAHLLLSLYLGCKPRVEAMEFSQIMAAVAQGRIQAGLVIHEGRFTYQRLGLVSMVDLGQWWEEKTGLPIPLGCIAVRRDLGPEAAAVLEKAVAASVGWARSHPGDSQAYVLKHAQEMEPEVVRQHIELYVNDFSLDLGEEGLLAVEKMLELGRKSGLIPPSQSPLTW